VLRTTWASTTTDVGRGHGKNRLAPERSADERALVARFAAGDHDAVAELYTRYSRPLYTVAMSVLRDSERARDCVQESFVKAWQAASTIDPTRPISPWLYAIARRTAIDILRRESRVRPTGDQDDVDSSVLPVSFESTWEAWELRRALDELPPDEQEVLRLAYFEGRTHSDIAARLGVPLGTVKSRSHRAHHHLAERLEHLAA
jgi:RNA polymerase sigma-70 factor, ECF subfamily